jgi:hypothetical protein
MKFILTVSFFLSVMLGVNAAQAGEKVWTIKYPQDACDEIVSQEYSTGGGDTVVQSVEILCRDKSGRYTGFVAGKGSISGYFKLGRFTMPDRFNYVPYSGSTLLIED